MTSAGAARRTSSATLSRMAARSMPTHAETPAGAGSGAEAGVVVMGLTSLGRRGVAASQQVGHCSGDAVCHGECPHRPTGVGPVGGDAVNQGAQRTRDV